MQNKQKWFWIVVGVALIIPVIWLTVQFNTLSGMKINFSADSGVELRGIYYPGDREVGVILPQGILFGM